MTIETLISLEDNTIYNDAVALINPNGPSAHPLQHDEVNTSINQIASRNHSNLLLNLIYTYVASKFHNTETVISACFNVQTDNLKLIDGIAIDSIPALCERLHLHFLNSEFSLSTPTASKIRVKSKKRLVELGAVYTPPNIVAEIVDSAFENHRTDTHRCKVLDFACGTGRFYEKIISEFSDKTQAILNNIYAVDIDLDAIRITRLKALSFFSRIDMRQCITLTNHIVHRNVFLIDNVLFHEPTAITNTDLDGLANAGFDIIVSNPPYRVLKPNRSKDEANNSVKIKNMVSYFRSCGLYTHAIEGMLNLYQLSIERMIQMLKDGGELGIICPSTLFGDVSASKLRRYLLLHNKIRSIRFFAEKLQLFDNVNQATSIFFLKKGGHTDNIIISNDNETFEIDISSIKEIFPRNLEIPAIKAAEWNILRRLSGMPKLKDLTFIRNKRGELDLSLSKRYITTQKTPYRLVRGNMIGASEIKDINGEYVTEEFVKTRSRNYYTFDFNRPRLICPQISNGGIRKRLKFIFCSHNDILGNSCNYISSDEKTLAKLHLILNSSILNWRFKITSSNNHINNYEIAELPIVNLNLINDSFNYSSQEELDDYIGTLYGLTPDEKRLIAI